MKRLALLALALAGCATSRSIEAVRSGNQLRSIGSLEAAEDAYERALTQGLTRDEWEVVRRDLCATRKERVEKITRSDALAKLTDTELAEELERVRKCRELLDEDLALSAEKTRRIFAKMDARVEPLVAASNLWEAVVTAASFMETLPSKNGRADWFVALQRRAKDQLEAAGRDLGPLAKDVLAQLAAFTGAPGAGSPPDPESTVTARLDAPPVFAFATIGAACAGRVTSNLAVPPAALPVVANDDAGYVASIDQCREAYDLVDAQEDYTVREQQLVKVKRTVYKTVTEKSFDVPRSVTRCGDILCHTYVEQPPPARQVTVPVVEEVEEMQEVDVVKQRPIKRLQRRLVVGVGVSTTHSDGAHRTLIEVELAATAGRYEPTTTNVAPDSSLFPDQTAELSALVATRSRAAAAELVRERRLMRWAWQAKQALASGDRKTGIDLLVAAWVGGHTLTVDHQQELARSLALKVSTVAARYAPRDLRNLTYDDKPIYVNGYAFTYPLVDLVLAKGYAPFGISALAQTDRAPSITGQPDRRTARANLGMFFDLAAFAQREPAGFSVYVPAGFNMELGGRTSDAYVFPAPTSASKMEETGLALGIELYAGALFGYRTARLGLLGGALASYQGHMIGAFRSSSGQLPLAARLELRPTRRFPWVLELWGLDVAGGDEFTRGARLDIPVATSVWLRTQLRQTRAESQTLGLNHEDFVALGVRDLMSFSAGVFASF